MKQTVEHYMASLVHARRDEVEALRAALLAATRD